MDQLPACCSIAVGGSLTEIGIAIGIGIEIVLGHEKLDVQRLSIGQVAWVYEKCARLKGVQEVLVVGLGLDKTESRQRKGELDPIAAILSRLGGRGYSVKEGFGECGYTEFDPVPDPDSDFDKIQPELHLPRPEFWSPFIQLLEKNLYC